MTNSDGNRHNVLKRHYYHKFESDRAPYSRRSSGESTAQFSFDELYLLPFTHQYSEDEQGRGGFVPLEQNLHPTGINVMDEYLQMLHQNCFSYAAFRQKYHAHSSDLSGLVFMLTGLAHQPLLYVSTRLQLSAFARTRKCRARPPVEIQNHRVKTREKGCACESTASVKATNSRERAAFSKKNVQNI